MPNQQRKREARLAAVGAAWAIIVLVTVAGRIAAGQPDPADATANRADWGWLPPGRGWSVRSHVDERLTSVAGALADGRTVVHCWSVDDWPKRASEIVRRSPHAGMLGAWRAYTSGRPRTINLSPQICEQLSKLVDGRRLDTEPDAYAWAIATFSHEVQHVGGIDGETEADCYGMQSIARTAQALGRTRADGRYLAVRYLRHWYAWSQPPYWSAECQDGGALDLHPETEVWP